MEGVRAKTCSRGGGYLLKHVSVSMSSLFLETVHSFKLHSALVIAINSNSTLPNYLMSRQSLIDRWGGTFPNMFNKGVFCLICPSMSSLFIVTVRSVKSHPG